MSLRNPRAVGGNEEKPRPPFFFRSHRLSTLSDALVKEQRRLDERWLIV